MSFTKTPPSKRTFRWSRKACIKLLFERVAYILSPQWILLNNQKTSLLVLNFCGLLIYENILNIVEDYHFHFLLIINWSWKQTMLENEEKIDHTNLTNHECINICLKELRLSKKWIRVRYLQNPTATEILYITYNFLQATFIHDEMFRLLSQLFISKAYFLFFLLDES